MDDLQRCTLDELKAGIAFAGPPNPEVQKYIDELFRRIESLENDVEDAHYAMLEQSEREGL